MKLQVINRDGASAGKEVDLPDHIFRIEPNDHAIYLHVKRIRHHFHRGTHKAKERAEIAGSTKKLRRQKGTGMARIGNIKSPILRGGGRTFGPRVRSYDIKLNKKVVKLARKSALSYKAKNEALQVLEDFSMEAPKTREFVGILNSIKSTEKKNLIVLGAEVDKNLLFSVRNIPNLIACEAKHLSTYTISNCDNIILTESGLDELKEILN